MTVDPDPFRAIEDSASAFVKRYMNVALKGLRKIEDKKKTQELEDIRKQADQDAKNLEAEFQHHPMPDFTKMKGDQVVAEIAKTFPGPTFEEVPDKPNLVRINGSVEFDAASLRRLPPSERKELFDATNMPESNELEREEKRKALKTLGSSGKMRLRIPQNAEDGRDHLQSIVDPSQKDILDGLYNAPETKIEDKYRAWDILNKITESDPEENKKREKERHTAALNFALRLSPENLPDMVECFEFADLILERKIRDTAMAATKKGIQDKKDEWVQNQKVKQVRLTQDVKDLTKEISDREEEIRKLKESGKDTKALDKLLGAKKNMKKGKETALGKVDPDPEKAPKIDMPTKPSSDERAKATDALLKELKQKPEELAKLAKEIEVEFSQYVDAVKSTGNQSGACACKMDPTAMLPDFEVAVGVAKNLRFGKDRAAAYHTQKHFNELDSTDQTGSAFKTEPEQRVDCYHVSARKTVAAGQCYKSAAGQNGGEAHHFKGSPCTAIVWLNSDRAGLATYFNL